MGYMRHHAIIVTVSYADIEEARNKAIEIFNKPAEGDVGILHGAPDIISNVVSDNINGHSSFFIAPDGSKEGWPESELGNERRAEFVQWLNDQSYGDGSNRFAWVEVQYGDEDGHQKVLNGSRFLSEE